MNADNATDTMHDRCARCDCEGAHDQQALLAELRAQVEALRRERDTAREDARLLGSVLARYTTIPRSRMAVLLWRSVRGRQARGLLAELRAQAEAARRERDEANDMLSTARSKLQMLVMAHAACRDQFMPGRPAAALDNAQAFLDAPRASRFVSLDAFRGVEKHRNALLRGLEAMRRDGLDIDDLHAAPVWTGKVLVGGRVVFDLATYEDAEAALEHERNNTMCSEAAAAAISSAAQMMRAALATDAGKEMLERVRAVERLEAERDAAQRALAVCVMQRDEARELVREYAEEHQRASAASALGRSTMCECPLCLKSARILEVKP